MDHQLTIRAWHPHVSSAPSLAAVLVGAVLRRRRPTRRRTHARKPRRQFVTVSYRLAAHAAAALSRASARRIWSAAPVAAAQFEDYDYRTRDEPILIDVLEFKRRGRGAGITVYPFGHERRTDAWRCAAASRICRHSHRFAGAGAPPNYELTGARAYDVGRGDLRRRSLARAGASAATPSSAAASAGSRATLGDGDRYFAEGGGGLSSGPFGVELSVKFAWNHLTEPVDHHFITVPVTLRGTLTSDMTPSHVRSIDAWLQGRVRGCGQARAAGAEAAARDARASTAALREADARRASRHGRDPGLPRTRRAARRTTDDSAAGPSLDRRGRSADQAGRCRPSISSRPASTASRRGRSSTRSSP